jgi:hypothetical protein
MICFSFFSSTKSENREEEDRTSPEWGRGIGTSGTGEVEEKGCRRVNTVQKMCTHVC